MERHTLTTIPCNQILQMKHPELLVLFAFRQGSWREREEKVRGKIFILQLVCLFLYFKNYLQSCSCITFITEESTKYGIKIVFCSNVTNNVITLQLEQSENCVDMNSQRILISLYNLLSASLLPQTGGQSDGTFFENKKNFHLCTLILATMLVFGGVQ